MPDLYPWDLEERPAVSYSVIDSYHLPLEMSHHCAPLTSIKLLADCKAEEAGAESLPHNDLGLVDNDPEDDDFDGQEMICWKIDHASP